VHLFFEVDHNAVFLGYILVVDVLNQDLTLISWRRGFYQYN